MIQVYLDPHSLPWSTVGGSSPLLDLSVTDYRRDTVMSCGCNNQRLGRGEWSSYTAASLDHVFEEANVWTLTAGHDLCQIALKKRASAIIWTIVCKQYWYRAFRHGVLSTCSVPLWQTKSFPRKLITTVARVLFKIVPLCTVSNCLAFILCRK